MDRSSAGAGCPAQKSTKPTSWGRGLRSSTFATDGKQKMDNQNTNPQSTDVNPIKSWKDAPFTDDDDVLQLALSIVCMLYGEHLMSFRLHHEGMNQFEQAVEQIYKLMKKNKVTCCEYPGL